MSEAQRNVTFLLPSLLGDHAVLQRGQPVRLWGWDCPGIVVRVEVAGDEATAEAGPDGRWEIVMPPLNVAGAFEIAVRGSCEKLFRDIVVGEIWLCSGQSNMTWAVKDARDGDAETQGADFPDIRLFDVPRKVAITPARVSQGHWQRCSPKSVASFSAAAYFFGRELHRRLGVPLGLVHASWGNTPIATWMSRQALESDPEFAPILQRWEEVLEKHPAARTDVAPFHREWQQAMLEYGPKSVEWMQQSAADLAAGRPPAPQPQRPEGPGNNQSPMLAYNAMVDPLAPWPIRGVIWYQGETDAIQGRSVLYRKLMESLISSWRRRWGAGDFWFLFVQLANFRDPQCEAAEDKWAELRESQRLAAGSIANCEMVVAADLGESANIHPLNKQEVGLRLAAAALSCAYGVPTPFAGPQLVDATPERGSMRLLFDADLEGSHLPSPLPGLMIAGVDRVFHPAAVKIAGRELIASADSVPAPVAVRYGWTDDPPTPLKGRDGLPASPFRTDDWTLTTESCA